MEAVVHPSSIYLLCKHCSLLDHLPALRSLIPHLHLLAPLLLNELKFCTPILYVSSTQQLFSNRFVFLGGSGTAHGSGEPSQKHAVIVLVLMAVA